MYATKMVNITAKLEVSITNKLLPSIVLYLFYIYLKNDYNSY